MGIRLVGGAVAILALGSSGATAAARTITVTVKSDGRFNPSVVDVRSGDTVVWRLADRHRDSIAPIQPGAPNVCTAFAPYTGSGEDFTGPMAKAPSGVFVLNPDGAGFVTAGHGVYGVQQLLRTKNPKGTGPEGAVMQQTWSSANNTGVLVRLRWNQLQPRGAGHFDWTIIDRAAANAAAHGKLFSLAIKAGKDGTPAWIFNAGVRKLTFRDYGSSSSSQTCQCGFFLDLGSPVDEAYRRLYLDMLTAIGKRLREKNAWFRALAYVKPSGANLLSAENRLPKRCETACTDRCKVPGRWTGNSNLVRGRICNTEVWRAAGYTAAGLYGFYREQFARIATYFPGKDMSYMLIHAGFPLVSFGGVTPQPQEQTEAIVDIGWSGYRERFAIQHNGLMGGRPLNGLVARKRRRGQMVGSQTTNLVKTAADVSAAFETALSHDLGFVEVYELAAWRADLAGTLDASATPQRTLGDWIEVFHDRRRALGRRRSSLGDPFPTEHRHTFTLTRRGASEVKYVNPYRCRDASTVGTLRLRR